MPPTESSFHVLTRDKLSAVLGTERGEALLRSILTEVGLPQVSSAQDMLRVAGALENRGVMERAVASILRFQAVLRASALPPRP